MSYVDLVPLSAHVHDSWYFICLRSKVPGMPPDGKIAAHCRLAVVFQVHSQVSLSICTCRETSSKATKHHICEEVLVIQGRITRAWNFALIDSAGQKFFILRIKARCCCTWSVFRVCPALYYSHDLLILHSGHVIVLSVWFVA